MKKIRIYKGKDNLLVGRDAHSRWCWMIYTQHHDSKTLNNYGIAKTWRDAFGEASRHYRSIETRKPTSRILAISPVIYPTLHRKTTASDYTPDTGQVRWAYIKDEPDDAEAEFDRWLNAVMTEAKAQAISDIGYELQAMQFSADYETTHDRGRWRDVQEWEDILDDIPAWLLDRAYEIEQGTK